MNCFCGCGLKLRRNQTDLALQVSRMALELLAWDKARAAGRLGPPAADDAERLIERGADRYRRLILSLHGESDAYSLEEGEAWIRESEEERSDRGYMTDKGGLFTPDKLLLTDEDAERLNRVRPELSFTGVRRGEDGDDQAASQLQRLGVLHAEGALSDAEFAAAKARVLGQDWTGR